MPYLTPEEALLATVQQGGMEPAPPRPGSFEPVTSSPQEQLAASISSLGSVGDKALATGVDFASMAASLLVFNMAPSMAIGLAGGVGAGIGQSVAEQSFEAQREFLATRQFLREISTSPLYGVQSVLSPQNAMSNSLTGSGVATMLQSLNSMGAAYGASPAQMRNLGSIMSSMPGAAGSRFRMGGHQNIDKISQDMREALQELTEIAEQINGDIDDAIQYYESFSRMGFSTKRHRLQALRHVQASSSLTGLGLNQVFDIASGVGAFADGLGLDRVAGFGLGMSNLNTAAVLQARGGMDPRYLRQIGGIDQYALRMSEIQLGAIDSVAGQTYMTRRFNPDGTARDFAVGARPAGADFNFLQRYDPYAANQMREQVAAEFPGVVLAQVAAIRAGADSTTQANRRQFDYLSSIGISDPTEQLEYLRTLRARPMANMLGDLQAREDAFAMREPLSRSRSVSRGGMNHLNIAIADQLGLRGLNSEARRRGIARQMRSEDLAEILMSATGDPIRYGSGMASAEDMLAFSRRVMQGDMSPFADPFDNSIDHLNDLFSGAIASEGLRSREALTMAARGAGPYSPFINSIIFSASTYRHDRGIEAMARRERRMEQRRTLPVLFGEGLKYGTVLGAGAGSFFGPVGVGVGAVGGGLVGGVGGMVRELFDRFISIDDPSLGSRMGRYVNFTGTAGSGLDVGGGRYAANVGELMEAIAMEQGVFFDPTTGRAGRASHTDIQDMRRRVRLATEDLLDERFRPGAVSRFVGRSADGLVGSDPLRRFTQADIDSRSAADVYDMFARATMGVERFRDLSADQRQALDAALRAEGAGGLAQVLPQMTGDADAAQIINQTASALSIYSSFQELTRTLSDTSLQLTPTQSGGLETRTRATLRSMGRGPLRDATRVREELGMARMGPHAEGRNMQTMNERIMTFSPEELGSIQSALEGGLLSGAARSSAERLLRDAPAQLGGVNEEVTRQQQYYAAEGREGLLRADLEAAIALRGGSGDVSAQALRIVEMASGGQLSRAAAESALGALRGTEVLDRAFSPEAQDGMRAAGLAAPGLDPTRSRFLQNMRSSPRGRAERMLQPLVETDRLAIQNTYGSVLEGRAGDALQMLTSSQSRDITSRLAEALSGSDISDAGARDLANLLSGDRTTLIERLASGEFAGILNQLEGVDDLQTLFSGDTALNRLNQYLAGSGDANELRRRAGLLAGQGIGHVPALAALAGGDAAGLATILESQANMSTEAARHMADQLVRGEMGAEGVNNMLSRFMASIPTSVSDANEARNMDNDRREVFRALARMLTGSMTGIPVRMAEGPWTGVPPASEENR